MNYFYINKKKNISPICLYKKIEFLISKSQSNFMISKIRILDIKNRLTRICYKKLHWFFYIKKYGINSNTFPHIKILMITKNIFSDIKKYRINIKRRHISNFCFLYFLSFCSLRNLQCKLTYYFPTHQFC